MKKIKPYLINTLIVIAIFIVTLILSEISPFGNNIIGKSDAIAQYKPMLYNYIMSLKTNSLEVFSFTNGLGNPFMFNFSYYLISPLNLIALPFNSPDTMYLSVILIKISFAALFTTYYAKKHNATNLTSTIATISYVFSGWFLAYYYNIMWLDTFMIFPLFQYGLENLIKNKKIYLFIFSLAYLYLTNFYLAFSALIYGLIYFIVNNFFYQEITLKDKFIGLLRFLISTILTILLILVYLYILVQVKNQTGLGASDVTTSGYITTTLDFFKSLFYGTTNLTTEFSGNTYPNIAINSLILINIFYFFINKKISTKDKIFALIGLNLIIGCFFIKQFDYVLNMFHNVIGLTYRYSFIFIFLGITLFIKNSNTLETKTDKRCYLIILFLIILLSINYKNIDFNIYILNLAFLISYTILIFFKSDNKIHKLLFLILVIIQSLLGCLASIPFVKEKENISLDNFQTEPTTYRLNTIGEDDFLNKNMYTNEKSTYLFTSMTYNPVLETVRSLGCDSGKNAISCYQNNTLFNMLFNVKNDYYLEKIYSVNKDILNVFLTEDNVKKSQEDLIKGMTGLEDIFIKETLKADIIDDKSYFKTEHDFYLIDTTIDNYTTNYPQEYQEFYYNTDALKTTDIYTLDDDKLKNIYDILNQNQITYTNYSDSFITGNITVSENQMIFTSIPYDESWEIKIDDEIVEPTMILDSLIGIECSPGEHTISLEYKTNYKTPLIISFITLIGLIISYIITKKKSN